MIGNRRVLGAAVAAVLVASLGALAGCASDEKPEVALTQKQVQAASVTLTVHDVNGAMVGQGSGILIAPRLVLTSGHLVAGQARWSVTSADGTTKVNGIRGMTYDWMDYGGSQNAHPRKHDVAVIYLDKPINLDVYPKLAAEGLANGATGTRLRSNGSSVLQLPQTFKKVVGFPHAYLTNMPSQESVEPGNAVLNDHNEIVGVVTGRGLTTGQMYVARTNDLTDWLQPKAQCGGRSSASVRTYGTPPPKPGCDTPGSSGNTSGGTSGATSGGTSGNTSGGTSGNTSGGTSGGSSGTSGDNTSGGTSGNTSGGTSGSSGQSSGTSGNTSGGTSGGSSGGTDNPSCHDGGGHCHGNCSGVPGGSSSGASGGTSGTSGNTSGSSGQTSSGASGGTSGSTSGSTSGTSGSTSGTSGTSGQTSGSSGTSGDTTSGSSSGSTSGSTSGSSGSTSGTSGTSGQSSGSSGQTSSGASGGTSGNTSGGTSSGGAGSDNNGDSEVCEGESDNPETCPPENDGCSGGSCGGAFAPDSLIEYSSGCGSCNESDGSDPVVVR